MSFYEHLRDGQLGEWCADNLPGTRAVAERVAAIANRGNEAVRPPRQDPLYYAAVGGMLDRRLAWLIDRSSAPTASILGAVRAGDIDPTEAEQIAEIVTGQEPRTAETMGLRDPNPAVYEFRKISRLVSKLPVGRFADDDQELALLHALAFLTSYDMAYRSHEGRTPDFDLDHDTLIADWRRLIAKNRSGLSLRVLRTLVANPASTSWGHASPTIVPQWAEADAVVGPHHDGGSTLIDFKTVTSVDYDLDRTMLWLWQILGYALLDAGDEHKIRRVGLWLTRHGVLIQWPLNDVLDEMAGGLGRWRQERARARLRNEFLSEARRAITADYTAHGRQVPADWSA